MTFAVIRVRGIVNIRGEIKDTLNMLRLHRVNHCVLISETPEYKGMLQKVKDYVTWGEVDGAILTDILKARGKLAGDKEITDKYIKSNSEFTSTTKFATAIAKGEAKITDLKGVKPVIRLHPPRKGYEGIKRAFTVGGALGYRGKKINELLTRMI